MNSLWMGVISYEARFMPTILTAQSISPKTYRANCLRYICIVFSKPKYRASEINA